MATSIVTLELMFLSLISKSGGCSASDLAEASLRDFARNISTAYLYIALRRLEEKGFVRRSLLPSSPIRKGRPVRQHYLTVEGEKELERIKVFFLDAWGLSIRRGPTGKTLLRMDPDLRPPPLRGKRRKV